MNKQTIFENIAMIIVGALIGVIIYFGCHWSTKQEEKNFYNGCQCGGHWEYQQAVGHQVYTGYIYKCDKCGDIIESDKYYKEERKEN